MELENRGFQDSAHRMVVIYLTSLALEAVYDRLLRPIDVRSRTLFRASSLFPEIRYTDRVKCSEGLDGMQTRIKIGLVAVGVTYIATILSILLGCRPFHKNWQINPDPGSKFRVDFLRQEWKDLG